MKRGLQIVLFVLSLIPLYFAVSGFMGGGAGLNGGQAVAADLDNQFRYLSAFYLILTFLIWYIIPAPESHTSIFRLRDLRDIFGRAGTALLLSLYGRAAIGNLAKFCRQESGLTYG